MAAKEENSEEPPGTSPILDEASSPTVVEEEEAPKNRVCRFCCCERCVEACCCAPGTRLYKLFLSWHLPVGLVLLVVLGIVWPVPGAWLSASTPLSTVCVVLIFLLSGLKLRTAELAKAVGSPWAVLYGLVMILGLSPCLGFAFVPIPIARDLAVGLAVFFACPSTISTAVLFTAQAEGNTALALFFSVATNILGTATVPFFVSSFLAASGASLNPVPVLISLLLSVLLPVVVGMLLRRFIPVVATEVRHEADAIKVASSVALILIPFMSVSASRASLLLLPPTDILAVVGIAIAAHLLLLLLNATALAFLPHTGLKEKKATFLSASQKTLAIALAVIAQLPASAGAPGILAVVAILAHFAQTIIDAAIAAKLATIKAIPCQQQPDTSKAREETPEGDGEREGEKRAEVV